MRHEIWVFTRTNVAILTAVEVSGQLSNQDIREEIETLWALTRHFD